MNRSLRNKLILSYLGVSLFTALSIYGLIRWRTSSNLQDLIWEQQISDVDQFVIAWYEENGEWEQFRDAYVAQFPPASLARNDGRPPRNPQQDNPPPPTDRPPATSPKNGVAIFTAENVALTSLHNQHIQQGDAVPDKLISTGFPVELNGETIAYIVPENKQIDFGKEEQAYLEHTNEVLLWAVVAGTTLAVLAGIGLAQILLRPIKELTSASYAMAQGDLKQTVPVRSRDELGQLATSFNQMSDDLHQAHEQRRQLTANIAHDIGTPLQVISGYTEAILDGTLPLNMGRIKTIATEAEYLRSLVNDLDLLSKTDTKTLLLDIRQTNLTKILIHVGESFTPLAQSKNIELATHLPPALPSIYADDERLIQVLGNLIKNGIQYTPKNGRIQIKAVEQAKNILIQIHDNGDGIPPEHLPHIFDRFYRVDEARSDGSNKGLGLAISKGLIDAMGGRISAENHPDQGAIFSIFLPKIG